MKSGLPRIVARMVVVALALAAFSALIHLEAGRTETANAQAGQIQRAPAIDDPAGSGEGTDGAAGYQITVRLGRRAMGLHFTESEQVRAVLPVASGQFGAPDFLIITPAVEAAGADPVIKVQVAGVWGEPAAEEKRDCKAYLRLPQSIAAEDTLDSQSNVLAPDLSMWTSEALTISFDGARRPRARPPEKITLSGPSGFAMIAPALLTTTTAAQLPCGRPSCPFCTCGEISCHPNIGKCIGCGDCGQCCRN